MEQQVTRLIPLAELEISRDNARRLPATDEDHRELMASIEALGLLNNLVVSKLPRAKKSGVKYAVIAGGRRLKAISGLNGEGGWPDDKPVPCSVSATGKESATEISLHENVVRTHMHPVDEYEAYRRMTTKGLSADAIASRLGVTAKHVKRYLRLADIHEDILEAARGDQINEEQLRAFGASSDKERQLQVWNDMRQNHGSQMPDQWIKREVLARHMSAGHSRVRFVGIEAYEAAGGLVERDLFTKENEEDAYITDVKLLDQLALDKLNAAAQKVQDGWKWVETAVACDWHLTGQYGQLESRIGEMTPEEAEQAAAIKSEVVQNEARIDDLEKLLRERGDSMTTEEVDQAQEETQELWTKNGNLRVLQTHAMRARREERATYDPGQMAHAGVIVTINSDGELHFHKGLVRADDAKTLPGTSSEFEESREAAEPEGDGNELDPTRTSNVSGYIPPMMPQAPRNTEQDAKAAAGLSQTLCDQLQTVRMNIVKASLSDSYDDAFDLLTFQLARRVLTPMAWGEESLHIEATSTQTHTIGAVAAGDGPSVFAPTEEQLENETRALPLDWLETEDRLAQFEAFSKLPIRAKKQLFATAVAHTLRAQLSFEPKAERLPEVEAVIQRLEVPLASKYRPNAKHFWERVKKSDALAVARAVLGPEWADAHAKDRRPELARALEDVFTATDKPIGINDRQWEGVQAWTPPGFRAFDRQGLDPERKVGDGTPLRTAASDDDDDNGDGLEADDGDDTAETAGTEAPAGFDRTPAAEAPAFLRD